jgi:D-arabinose 1-dehydrogenase-like Zn-dependent alcohol dehydrogenase
VETQATQRRQVKLLVETVAEVQAVGDRVVQRRPGDRVLVPFQVSAPTDVPPTALATLPDNVVAAYRTVAPHLRGRPGADVLVVGGAAVSIALYAAAIAVTLGAGRTRPEMRQGLHYSSGNFKRRLQD